jgi:hypothetical protein
MPFSSDDFPEFFRQLEQHPEWRAELRRHVLSDELLALPDLVRQLIEAQARTDERIEALTVEIRNLTEALKLLTRRVDGATDDIAALKGDMLEFRYRERAPAYFGPIARRLWVLSTSTLADRLDDAVDEGRLSDSERKEILLTDLVLTGRRREDQAEIYLLAEISIGIGPHNVDRAADRSTLLRKLGLPVLAVAAGKSVNAEAADLARARGVILRLDGSEAPPILV